MRRKAFFKEIGSVDFLLQKQRNPKKKKIHIQELSKMISLNNRLKRKMMKYQVKLKKFLMRPLKFRLKMLIAKKKLLQRYTVLTIRPSNAIVSIKKDIICFTYLIIIIFKLFSESFGRSDTTRDF